MAGRTRTCGASRFRRPLYRAELRPRVSGQGWTRTSSLLFVRQALSAIELLAQETPGQGLEPRPPRSERGVLAVRRSRKDNDRLFMPLAHASTLDRCGTVAAARLRGGVLEPGARSRVEMCRQKQPSYTQRQLPRSSGRGPFSLRRGLDSVLGLLQAEHHLVVIVVPPSNDEGDPLGSPSLRVAMPNGFCRHDMSVAT